MTNPNDPNLEIQIKTTGANAAANEIKKVDDATVKTTEHVEKHSGALMRWTKGLKELIREVPVLGTVLHALHNPIVLIGVAGAAAFEAIKKGAEAARESQENYDKVLTNTKVITSIENLKVAADSLAAAQKELATQTGSANEVIQKQIDLLNEAVEAQVKILDAQKEVEAAKIEANEKDPVAKARKLAANDLRFGAMTLGLRKGSTAQQVGLIEKQIAQERALQTGANAEGAIPTEAGMRAALNDLASHEAALPGAQRENREAFRKAELARMVIRRGNGEIGTELSSPEANEILKMGLGYWDNKSVFRLDVGAAQKQLPGLASASEEARIRYERLQASRRSILGTLPRGVGSSSDPAAVAGAAESAEAAVQNESYFRQQKLEEVRDRLIRNQAGANVVGGLQLQRTKFTGQASYEAAVQERMEQYHKAMMEKFREIEADVKRSGSNNPPR